MKLIHSAKRVAANQAKQGAALLLSFMVLVVVVTIVTQISIGTMTDARVARNDVTLARMDLAIESAMLQARLQLRDDAAADAGGEGDEGGGAGAEGGPPVPSIGGGGDEEGLDDTAVPADTKADFAVERTEINQISLRILTQDEDSKINILNMLSEDEDLAEEGFLRVVRVLDLFREGTDYDLPMADAQEIAETIRRHMLERDAQTLPKTVLLSDDVERERIGLPLSMREFLIHEEVPEILFVDFRDEDDAIVHSIESFLTVYSSPKLFSNAAASDDPGALPQDDAGAPSSDGGPSSSGVGEEENVGGFAVNLNTAPPVVLKSLFDNREVNPAFWDEVIEYRNLEDEAAMEDENGEEREPIYDEFGEEQVELQYFGSVDDLTEVRSWGDFDVELQGRIKALLTTRSSTFSIIVTARKPTSTNDTGDAGLTAAELARKEETSPALKLVVRSVVWRHQVEEEFEVSQIIPWETLRSSPFEVLDYPREDR